MKVVDVLILTPVALLLVISVRLWQGTSFEPWLGIAMMGLLTVSGAILLARETFAEARDAKRLNEIKRRT